MPFSSIPLLHCLPRLHMSCKETPGFTILLPNLTANLLQTSSAYRHSKNRCFPVSSSQSVHKAQFPRHAKLRRCIDHLPCQQLVPEHEVQKDLNCGGYAKLPNHLELPSYFASTHNHTIDRFRRVFSICSPLPSQGILFFSIGSTDPIERLLLMKLFYEAALSLTLPELPLPSPHTSRQ